MKMTYYPNQNIKTANRFTDLFKRRSKAPSEQSQMSEEQLAIVDAKKAVENFNEKFPDQEQRNLFWQYRLEPFRQMAEQKFLEVTGKEMNDEKGDASYEDVFLAFVLAYGADKVMAEIDEPTGVSRFREESVEETPVNEIPAAETPAEEVPSTETPTVTRKPLSAKPEGETADEATTKPPDYAAQSAEPEIKPAEAAVETPAEVAQVEPTKETATVEPSIEAALPETVSPEEKENVRDIGAALKDTFEAIKGAQKAHNEAAKLYRWALEHYKDRPKFAYANLLEVKRLLEDRFSVTFRDFDESLNIGALPKWEQPRSPTVTRKGREKVEPEIFEQTTVVPETEKQPVKEVAPSPAVQQKPRETGKQEYFTVSRPKIIRLGSSGKPLPKIRLTT